MIWELFSMIIFLSIHLSAHPPDHLARIRLQLLLLVHSLRWGRKKPIAYHDYSSSQWKGVHFRISLYWSYWTISKFSLTLNYHKTGFPVELGDCTYTQVIGQNLSFIGDYVAYKDNIHDVASCFHSATKCNQILRKSVWNWSSQLGGRIIRPQFDTWSSPMALWMSAELSCAVFRPAPPIVGLLVFC